MNNVSEKQSKLADELANSILDYCDNLLQTIGSLDEISDRDLFKVELLESLKDLSWQRLTELNVTQLKNREQELLEGNVESKSQAPIYGEEGRSESGVDSLAKQAMEKEELITFSPIPQETIDRVNEKLFENIVSEEQVSGKRK